MKTYLFPEIAGHGEITEWVPADVARDLLDALQTVVDMNVQYCKARYGDKSKAEEMGCVIVSREAIKKACDK
tara:strand:- start:11237 stop:11452 length:216 start_codon:yes stop_codon:yes gene_type:complete